MRKVILLIGLLCIVSGLSAQGIYSPPGTIPTYGSRDNRRIVETALLFPTGCGAPVKLGMSSVDSLHAAKYFDSCNNKEYTWNPKIKAWRWILDSVTATVSTTGNADSLQHIIGTNYIQYGGTAIATGSTSTVIAAGTKIVSIDFYDPALIYVSIGTSVNGWQIAPRFTISAGTYSTAVINKYFASGATIYFNGVTASTIIRIYKL